MLPHVVPGDDDAAADPCGQDAELPRRDGARDVTASAALRWMLLRRIDAGEIRAAFVMEDDIAADPAIAAALAEAGFPRCACVTNESETTRLADVVFPAADVRGTERDVHEFPGTRAADPSVGDDAGPGPGIGWSRDEPVGRFGTSFDRWGRGAKRDARPRWKIIAGIASVMGMKYRYRQAEDVFAELASAVEAFKGMTYRSLGSRGQMLAAPREQTVRS